MNDDTTNPIIAEATVNGSTVILGDVGTDATVTLSEEVTVSEELNVTHSITGDVTAGETTTEVDPVSVTVVDTDPPSQTANPVIVGDTPATDTDADGLFEDVNGDGEANFDDGIDLTFNIDAASSNRESFDFDADGNVDFDDAISLVFQV